MEMKLGCTLVYLFLCLFLIDEGQPEKWYVKPSHESICPENVTFSQCKVFSEYLSNMEKYFKNDTIFEFLSGQHKLNETLDISGVHNLTLAGNQSQVSNVRYTSPQSGIRIINSSEIIINHLHILSDNTWEVPLLKEDMVSVSFHDVGHICIIGLTISGSSGLGMQTKSCYGHMKIQDSNFMKNRRGNVAIETHAQNCSLNVTASNFTNGGKEGSADSGLAVYSHCPGMSINIEQVHATNNSGNNIKLIMHDYPHQQWSIVIKESEIAKSKGAGVNFSSVNSHGGLKYSNCNHSMDEMYNVFKIIKTNFTSNQACNSSGALMVRIFDSSCKSMKLQITKCLFDDNKINSTFRGVAVKIVNRNVPSFHIQTKTAYEISLLNTTFCNNFVIGSKGSVIESVNIDNLKIENCSFVNNTGTALSMRSSNVVFTGEILFQNNSGYNGGALEICSSSFIFINNNTNISFVDNRAKYTGGAIFAEQSCLGQPKACFFQPLVTDNTDIELFKTDYKMILSFINNTAEKAGNAVYGGEMDTCYTFKSFDRENASSFFHSPSIFNAIFNFTENSNNSVASDPYEILFCSNLTTVDVAPEVKNVSVIPGKWFYFIVIPVGHRHGMAPGIVMADLKSGSTPSLTLFTNISSQITGCRKIYMRLKKNTKVECTEIILEVQRNNPGILHSKHVARHIYITIGSCPWGFYLAYNSGFCECEIIGNFPFHCNIDLEAVVLYPHYGSTWLGCLEKDRQNNCSGNNLAAAHSCGYVEYCNYSQYQEILTKDSVDQQCVEGRSGRLCGSCVDGYSLVLGTSECKMCSNAYVSLIVVYLGAGVFLFAVLIVFHNIFNISNGSLNGLIFYAYFIHYNRIVFFPHFFNGDIFRMLIAWLNFDLGIEVCFYNGMDAYQKIWLQIGYVIYMCILLAVMILLSQKFIRFTRLLGRNANKVVSTVIFLLYSKALRITVEILYFTRLETADHESIMLWSKDGSYKYLSPLHVPLFVVAIVLLLLLLSFTLFLLFIQVLSKKMAKFKCCRWIPRLYPFFDTFTGPCNKNYLFWPGLLLFLRGAYSFYVITLGGSFNREIYVTISVCGLLILFSLVIPKGIYKHWLLNLVEVAILLNLLFISLIAFSNEYKIKKHEGIFATYVSVTFALATFMIYHLKDQVRKIISKLRQFKTVHKCLRKQLQVSRPVVTHSEVRIGGPLQEERAPLLKVMPPVIDYKNLREPLIDEVLTQP